MRHVDLWGGLKRYGVLLVDSFNLRNSRTWRVPEGPGL